MVVWRSLTFTRESSASWLRASARYPPQVRPELVDGHHRPSRARSPSFSCSKIAAVYGHSVQNKPDHFLSTKVRRTCDADEFRLFFPCRTCVGRSLTHPAESIARHQTVNRSGYRIDPNDPPGLLPRIEKANRRAVPVSVAR